MPNFNVSGLQYFGVIEVSNVSGSTLQCIMTDIYNNTGFTFSGGNIAANTSNFTINSDVNFAGYQYSITLTPQDLINNNPSSGIPFYTTLQLVTENLINVSMADYEGNDYNVVLNNAITYFINIRLT